jgi:hypothetical protein
MICIAVYCPVAERSVRIGVETDDVTFTQLLRSSAHARCPVCGAEHGPLDGLAPAPRNGASTNLRILDDRHLLSALLASRSSNNLSRAYRTLEHSAASPK